MFVVKVTTKIVLPVTCFSNNKGSMCPYLFYCPWIAGVRTYRDPSLFFYLQDFVN